MLIIIIAGFLIYCLIIFLLQRLKTSETADNIILLIVAAIILSAMFFADDKSIKSVVEVPVALVEDTIKEVDVSNYSLKITVEKDKIFYIKDATKYTLYYHSKCISSTKDYNEVIADYKKHLEENKDLFKETK